MGIRSSENGSNSFSSHRVGTTTEDSPAIVAGKVRKDRHNYRLLTHYVGNGEVRKHFDQHKEANRG